MREKEAKHQKLHQCKAHMKRRVVNDDDDEDGTDNAPTSAEATAAFSLTAAKTVNDSPLSADHLID